MRTRIGVLILSLTLALGMAVPALAGVKVGGEVNFEWSYGYYNDEWAGGEAYFGLHNFTDNGGSTLSVEWTSDDEKFMAFCELSLYYSANGNAVETSQVFIAYKTGLWELSLGQMDSDSDVVGPSQCLDAAAGIEGYGNSTLDTNEQVRVAYGEQYRFIFALTAPYRGDVWGVGQTHYYLPGVTGAMELTFGNVLVHPWVHFENVQLSGPFDDHYNSFDAGLEIEGEFGLVGFSVGVNYGLNTSQNGVIVSADPVLKADGKVDQSKPALQYGGWGEVRVSGLAMGGGIQAAQRDDWAETAYAWSAYVNYGIEFGSITITPEVVVFNAGEDNNGVAGGWEVLAGAVASLAF